MALSFVDPSIDSGDELTSCFLIYGPPGVGKTAGSGTSPGPILYLNAEGSGRARFARRKWGEKLREVAVTGKAVLREAILSVRAGEWKGGTVVLDTVGETYRVLVDEEAGEGSIPKIQDYGNAGKTLERFIRYMRDADVNLVIVSHEEMTDGPDGPLLMPGGFGRSLPAKVCGWVDYVGYAGVVSGEDEDGDGESETRRVCQFEPGRGRYAKNSEGALPKVAEFNIEDWLKRIASVGQPEPATTTRRGRK